MQVGEVLVFSVPNERGLSFHPFPTCSSTDTGPQPRVQPAKSAQLLANHSWIRQRQAINQAAACLWEDMREI